LPELRAGRVTSPCSCKASGSEERQVDLPRAGPSLTLDMTLRPSGFRDEVVVTGAREPAAGPDAVGNTDSFDRQPAYDRLTDATYRNAGLFMQDDWAMAKGLELVYGLRADKHSQVHQVIVSPRLTLMASPRESLRGAPDPPRSRAREERSTNYVLGAEW